MKKLQNNFTTPEQSKRLLELGVSADSADCYYNIFSSRPIVKMPIDCFTDKVINEDYIPCWSVGRLVEIYLTCALEYHPYDDFYTETPTIHFMAFDKNRLINEIIELFEEDEMDFSKLEE